MAGKSTFYGAVLTVQPTATILEIGCAVAGKVTNYLPTPITITHASDLYQRGLEPGYANSVSCYVGLGQSFAKCVQAAVTKAPVIGGNATSSRTCRSTATFEPENIHCNAFVVTAGAQVLIVNSTSTRNPSFATGYSFAAPGKHSDEQAPAFLYVGDALTLGSEPRTSPLHSAFGLDRSGPRLGISAEQTGAELNDRRQSVFLLGVTCRLKSNRPLALFV